MRSIKTKFFDGQKIYDGKQLRPHFLLTEGKLESNAVGAWIGACEVKTEALVDWEDRMVGDFIRSKKMIHFIGEFFGASMPEAVGLQRLFMSLAQNEIQKSANVSIRRSGDDLFFEDFKLSVSIVTASAVSKLLHVGINIDSEGAPVKAKGLKDLGSCREWSDVEFQGLTERILKTFEDEWNSIEWACVKVRPVI